jgi:translation initiation factor IF-2
MAEISTIRLNLALRELNISLDRAVEFLAQQNIEIEGRPTSKISKNVYQLLLDEFETDKSKKDASHEISEEKRKEKESLRILQEKKEQERLEQQKKRQEIIKAKASISKPVTLGKIDLDPSKPKSAVGPIAATPPVAKPTPAPKTVTAPVEDKKETELKTDGEAPVATEKKEATPATQQSDSNAIKTQYKTLSGPKKTGQTIDLDEFKK